MLNLLLPVVPALVFCLLHSSFRAGGFGERVIKSAVVWGFVLAALTEGLSACHALTRYNLAIGWGFALVGSGAYAVSRGLRLHREGWPRLPEPIWAYGAMLGAVILPTFVISVLTLPNTWDALTYHVARVDHWVQDRTVDFYPVLDQRANELAPFSEYIVLNFRLLSGSYALANLTQWCAMIGSLISIHSIANALDASKRGAWLAVVFGATVPMGILQASSTETDYCAAFWLLAFIAQFLRWRATRRWRDLAFGSAALGLALLTKGTAVAFALPFGLWLLADLVTLSRMPLRHRTGILAICGLLVLLPSLPHAARNMEAYGNPLGGPIAQIVVNHAFSPPVIAATLVRDVALQFATPSASINHAIVDRLVRLAAIVGIDLKDTASTFGGRPFSIERYVLHEDFAGNPLHTAMIIGLLIVLPWLRPADDHADRIYAGCAVFGFLLFSVLFKWQPWGSRLMLPGLLVWAPLVGVTAARFTLPVFTEGFAALLLLSALPYAYWNFEKPLVATFRPPIWQLSRHATTFTSRPELEEQYAAVASYLRRCDCDQVGLVTDLDSWVTPVFSAMAKQGFASFRIEDVEFATPLARVPYPLGPFSPKAILWLGGEKRDVIRFAGVNFVPAFETKDLRVYRPEPHRPG